MSTNSRKRQIIADDDEEEEAAKMMVDDRDDRDHVESDLVKDIDFSGEFSSFGSFNYMIYVSFTSSDNCFYLFINSKPGDVFLGRESKFIPSTSTIFTTAFNCPSDRTR